MKTNTEQAYYQYMRQQQIYHAYAAAVGYDPTPTPEPTFYNIKFTTTYKNPDVVTGISVITDSQTYDDITINGSGKDILSGTNISYFIELSHERAYPVIRYINGEMVEGKQTYQSPQFTLTEDNTISIGITDF